jgi:glycosyltransferase involved in cell wall biosynthesis
MSSPKLKCVPRFAAPASDIPTGAQAYERMLIEAISPVVETLPALCDPRSPRWLRFKKLRFLWQNKTALPQGDLLITDPTQLFCGLKIDRFERRILVVYHVDSRDTPSRFVQDRVDAHALRHLHRFDHVVVIADFWRKMLSEHMPAEKISLIHCGYDTESSIRCAAKDRDAARKELGLPLDKMVVFAGQACVSKGFTTVLERLPKDRFHVFTTGRKDFNAGQDHRELSEGNYLKLLSVADVAAFLPRFNEGWTRAAHEALLCGTPLVGFDRGGLGDLLRGAGQIVCESEDAFPACVEDALSRREELAQVGRAFAESFTVDRFAEEWRSLTREVCGLDPRLA